MEFGILGPLEVRDGDREVRIQGVKPRAILALLLLHADEVVSTDRIVEELWGGTSPPTATTAVQGYVSQLRKVLEPQHVAGEAYRLLVTRPPGYVVRVRADELDLAKFERLRTEAREAFSGGDAARSSVLLHEALWLWRGPPLADVSRDSFARAEIARLGELHAGAFEERIEADLALGREAEVVVELETLVARYPFRERLRGQLMLALYRAGRQAEALDAYRQARSLLREQLGLEPSELLNRLQRAILEHDPSLERATKTASAVAQPREATRAILVSPRTPSSLGSPLALACPLAGTQPPHEVLIACVVDAAELTTTAAMLSAKREELIGREVAVRAAAFTSPTPAVDLVRLAREQDVDLLVLDTGGSRLDDQAIQILEQAPCDVAIVVEEGGPIGIGPVIVPFGGAENDWAALELGAWLAHATGAPLRLVGAASDRRGGERDASSLLADASLIVQRTAGVFCEPLLAEAGRDGIATLAAGAGFLVVGLSERWRREGLGQTRSELAVHAVAPTAFVRRGLRPGGLAPFESRGHFTWSMGATAI